METASPRAAFATTTMAAEITATKETARTYQVGLCMISFVCLLLRSALTDALLRLFGTHCRKLSLIVTLLLCLTLGWRHSSSPGLSLFPLPSVAHCLAPAPLKLRPYGARQIRLLVLLLCVKKVTRHFSCNLIKESILIILSTTPHKNYRQPEAGLFFVSPNWRF